MWKSGETRVFTVNEVDLKVVPHGWRFADRHRAEIDAHWETRARETPRFFNGVVHLLSSYEVSLSGLLSARFVRTDFASFLYWRETGWRDQSVMDAFGTGLVYSADGNLLLGQQRSGNLNGSTAYPPSGFIDPADVTEHGTIDIDQSVAREIEEETGLDGDVLQRRGGYVLTIAGPVLSIGVPFRCALSDADIIRHAAQHFAADPDSELDRIILAAHGDPLAGLKIPDYARALWLALPGLQSGM